MDKSATQPIGGTGWTEILAHKGIRHLLIIILFGCIYACMDWCDAKSQHFSGTLHGCDPWYFSTVCQSTAGFGDFSPRTQSAKIVVMAQFGIMLSNLIIL